MVPDYVDLVARLVVLLSQRPLSAALFPYTTLFRSEAGEHHRLDFLEAGERGRRRAIGVGQRVADLGQDQVLDVAIEVTHLAHRRSEEHTSELQSQSNLVCRLLLEKKKPADGPRLRRSRCASCCIAESASTECCTLSLHDALPI